VEVPALQGGSYCVDSTEVSNAQYLEFLVAKGTDMTGQDPWCAWNTTYTPSTGLWPPSDQLPVKHVNWCDAFAFCKWAGKHLCGKIGGGPNSFADYANPTASQWYNACSHGGAWTYPYGTAYQPTACNTLDNGVGATVPVGSKVTCEGGFPGLYDMSGNVWEWEDACNGNTDQNDQCRIRGGPYDNGGDYGMCSTSDGALRNDPRAFGFRCCAETI